MNGTNKICNIKYEKMYFFILQIVKTFYLYIFTKSDESLYNLIVCITSHFLFLILSNIQDRFNTVEIFF